MKKIYRDKITNIPGTDLFDASFCVEYLFDISSSPERKIIFLKDLLQARKNQDILPLIAQKPAMWSELYSPKDELEIFQELFEHALSSQEKIHIVGVTLSEEIKMLEAYYEKFGFLREDINAFDVDFSVPLITVSCHIENLIWKGSDYKAMREKIFFCPPIRESGENKALFKGITRGVIAGIEISQDFWNTGNAGDFIKMCVKEEKILPLQLGRILKYNLEDAGLEAKKSEYVFSYE